MCSLVTDKLRYGEFLVTILIIGRPLLRSPATLFTRPTLGNWRTAIVTGNPLTLSVYIGCTLPSPVVNGNFLTLLNRSFSPPLTSLLFHVVIVPIIAPETPTVARVVQILSTRPVPASALSLNRLVTSGILAEESTIFRLSRGRHPKTTSFVASTADRRKVAR